MDAPGTRPALSVVIPAFNEERRLGPTLDRILAYLGSRHNAEIIVVDDGSSDGTGAVAEARRGGAMPLRILRSEANAGKGASVKRGVAAATGDVILFSDADLSTPIEEVEKLLAAIRGGADLAIGSRGLPDARIEVRQRSYREWMGKTFNWMVRAVSGLRFRDTQCGFKAFRRDAAHTLFAALEVEGFGFDVEILVRAQAAGYRIAEVPVVWRNSEFSKVDPVRDSLRMARDLLRVRLMRPPRKTGEDG